MRSTTVRRAKVTVCATVMLAALATLAPSTAVGAEMPQATASAAPETEVQTTTDNVVTPQPSTSSVPPSPESAESSAPDASSYSLSANHEGLGATEVTVVARVSGPEQVASIQVHVGPDADHLRLAGSVVPQMGQPSRIVAELAPTDVGYAVTALDWDGNVIRANTYQLFDLIAAEYSRLGGPSSFLGDPTGARYAVPGGSAQNYVGGAIFDKDGAPYGRTAAIGNELLGKYREIGGPSSFAGFPKQTMTTLRDGKGKYVEFENSTEIVSSPETGVHYLTGTIASHWSPDAVLNYPTSDTIMNPAAETCQQRFQDSATYAYRCKPGQDGTYATTHSLRLLVYDKWTSLGQGAGPLGLPLHFHAMMGGRWELMTFDHGQIVFNDTRAIAVYGPIFPAWQNQLYIGMPIDDQRRTPDGTGLYQHCDTGSVYWSPQTGAYAVRGAIRDKWAALGWERSVLGYPVTHEQNVPSGIPNRTYYGRYSHFQYGSIYWSPETGAHEVHGAIRDKWAALGWEAGPLGYPVTDEMTTPDGRGRYVHFQHGSIYWTPQTGAHEVYGSIRNTWAAQGWERGRLGYPTSGEYTPASGQRRSNFEGGYILWYAFNGSTRLFLQ